MKFFNNFSFDKSVKLNSYNYIADDIEQVIDKGSKVQLEVYNLLSEEKIFEHKIMNNWTRSIKKYIDDIFVYVIRSGDSQKCSNLFSNNK